MRWPWQPRTEDRQAVGGYTGKYLGADRGAGGRHDPTSVRDGRDRSGCGLTLTGFRRRAS